MKTIKLNSQKALGIITQAQIDSQKEIEAAQEIGRAHV